MYVGMYLHNLAWFDDEGLKSTNKINKFVSLIFDVKVNTVFESWFLVPFLLKLSEILHLALQYSNVPFHFLVQVQLGSRVLILKHIVTEKFHMTNSKLTIFINWCWRNELINNYDEHWLFHIQLQIW